MIKTFRLTAFLLVSFTIAGTAAAQVKGRRAIDTQSAPKAAGPYSQAIAANGFIYVAGQVGADPKTGALAEGMPEQLEQVINNLEAILKAAGSGLDRVVKTTVFLADMNDFAKLNEIYGRRFKAPHPACSTVQVARLPRDARVEIEAIALAGDK